MANFSSEMANFGQGHRPRRQYPPSILSSLAPAFTASSVELNNSMGLGRKSLGLVVQKEVGWKHNLQIFWFLEPYFFDEQFFFFFLSRHLLNRCIYIFLITME